MRTQPSFNSRQEAEDAIKALYARMPGGRLNNSLKNKGLPMVLEWIELACDLNTLCRSDVLLAPGGRAPPELVDEHVG